jgi:hypothetical protein
MEEIKWTNAAELGHMTQMVSLSKEDTARISEFLVIANETHYNEKLEKLKTHFLSVPDSKPFMDTLQTITEQHVKDFVKSLNTDNILLITYTSDYSIAAERGSFFSGLMHQKPPAYVIKTNRYSFTTLIGLIPETYFYEWDYMTNETDLNKLIKLFTKLANNTTRESSSTSSLVNVSSALQTL